MEYLPILKGVLLQTESDISLFIYSCITSRGKRDEEETKTVYSTKESDDSETAYGGQYCGIGSDLCDEHVLHPNVFYRWQTQFFEGGAAAFEPGPHANSGD
jgi:hypothetical protein